MTPERWQQIKEVFDRVLACDAAQRSEQLARICAADAELRCEVESLLHSEDRAGSRFLNTPIADVTSPPAASPATRVGSRIGAYTILELVGRGGMGDVYRATRMDGEFKQEVAIKLVREGYDSSSILERFRNERQILAGLNHPNIARLFDGGTMEEGVPYLVMEFVDGHTIDTYCDAHRLNVTHRLALFRQVCAAVEYAHQRLVVHRDLKPGNILVTKSGAPKLLDFGIAKILNPALAAEVTVARPMTPEYASPEQVRGEVITTASDVYSLGVILYQLLTSRSPYNVQTRTPHELARAITDAEPERPSAAVLRRQDGGDPNRGNAGFAAVTQEASPSRLHKRLQGDLDDILLRALRKEPALRYASVEQLDADLRRHLEGLPVYARRGSWSYRAGKFMRRNLTVVAAAMVVLVTLLTGMVVTLHEAHVAEANRRRADARFNDVRKLANSLIYEIHDSIRDLPGATQARKLILQRSLEYLDNLAKESGNDPALLRELAMAYGRIGDLQGNPTDPNLGDTKATLVSYQKSLQIRESLARANPGNSKDQIELAVADLDYSEFARSAMGDTPAAFDYCQRAVAILEREAAASPDSVRIVAQSTRAYTDLGMMQVGEGAMGSVGTVRGAVLDLRKALSLDERLLELSPSFANGRGQGAGIDAVLGDAMLKLGDRPSAELYFQKALDILRESNPKRNNIRSTANTSVVLTKVADVYLMEGRNSEAVASDTQAEEIADKLLAADPHNELLQRLVITSCVGLGHVLMDVGRYEQGLKYIRKAQNLLQSEPAQTLLTRTIEAVIEVMYGEGLEHEGKMDDALSHYTRGKEIIAAVRDAQPGDPLMQIYFSVATNRLGAAFLQLGRTEDARKEFDQSLALMEPLFGAHGEDQEVLYSLADTYTSEGMASAKFADHSSVPADKLANWRAARHWFQKSLSIWGKISNPTRMSTSGVEAVLPDEVSHRLAKCDTQIASLRMSVPAMPRATE